MNKIGIYLLLFLAAIVVFFSGYYLLDTQESESTVRERLPEDNRILTVIPGLSNHEITLSVVSVDEFPGGEIIIEGDADLLDFFLRDEYFRYATRGFVVSEETPVYIEKENSEPALADISDIEEGGEILVKTEEPIEEILLRNYFYVLEVIILNNN